MVPLSCLQTYEMCYNDTMNNQIKHLSNGDFEVVKLDDPNFLESEQKRKDIMDKCMIELQDAYEEMEKEKEEYEQQNDTWWNGLSYDERCSAFYAVMKRLYQGEIEKDGSYRYVLYDVFGFGPEMYARGMDCGYIVIHNRIMSEEEHNTLWKLRKQNYE